MLNTIELLAPAKNLDIGTAAINSGADAVYIGAPLFGAREAAANPLADIEELIAYAHHYWARVYVTLNTLLYDHELPHAVEMVRRLYDMGVDALIIQDMGLLECGLPPIPLFASTQMHNHTLERVRFLEKIGFQRVILARELSLPEIGHIRQNTSIELETFIHGSLCVSYSGQCYASYALGGRSANRGQCAQPCRRLYDLVDSDGKTLTKKRHLLSLKDLNLADDLETLCQAGINSFKIEGRLKDKAYVKNVVGFYRQKLDEIFQNGPYRQSSSGKTRLHFSPDPQKTFNRGYTTFLLKDRDPEMASLSTPKSTGEPVGKVSSTGQDYFILSEPHSLHNGDGICFFNTQSVLCGTLVNRVDGLKVFPQKMDGIFPGVLISRNDDRLFNAQLNKDDEERKIGVSMGLDYLDGALQLTLTDDDGNSVLTRLEYQPQPAENPQQATANISKQLTRLGESCFECTAIINNLPAPYFIPLSTLNRLRRQGVDDLLQERLNNIPRFKSELNNNPFSYPEKNFDYHGNVLNEKARAFYLKHGVDRLSPAAESGLDLSDSKIMTSRYCIRFQAGLCTREAPGRQARQPLYLIDEDGKRFLLKFDCVRCLMEVYFNPTEP